MIDKFYKPPKDYAKSLIYQLLNISSVELLEFSLKSKPAEIIKKTCKKVH
jgi:hypothetical protein